jgi:hypothetical protein
MIIALVVAGLHGLVRALDPAPIRLTERVSRPNPFGVEAMHGVTAGGIWLSASRGWRWW